MAHASMSKTGIERSQIYSHRSELTRKMKASKFKQLDKKLLDSIKFST